MRIRHCIIPVLLAALLCQWTSGNLQPHRLGFPLNGTLSLAFLAGIWVMANEWGKKEWMRTLRSGRMACTLLACIAVWCVVGGLVSPHAQARWLSLMGLTDFTTSWPFVALLVLLLVHLALATLHRLKHFGWHSDGAFVCVHGGLWMALASGLVGSTAYSDYRAVVNRDESVHFGFDSQGRRHPLGYELQLADFSIERNETDQSPVQYRASVLVDDHPVELAVNAPHSVRWDEDLYLASFDTSAAQPRYCIIQVVRQPAKYATLAGIALLMLGVGWTLLGRHGTDGAGKAV